MALLGANGAGKSTTLMSIMRLPPPEGPRVTGGRPSPVTGPTVPIAAHTVVAKYGIGLVSRGQAYFGNLTVFENLKLATFARNDKQQIERDYEGYSRSSPPCRPQNAEGGSSERRREADACLGRAFMSGVRFILLDEPSMGLSASHARTFQVLKSINEGGTPSSLSNKTPASL